MNTPPGVKLKLNGAIQVKSNLLILNNQNTTLLGKFLITFSINKKNIDLEIQICSLIWIIPHIANTFRPRNSIIIRITLH
jgi:hypothetical protein